MNMEKFFFILLFFSLFSSYYCQTESDFVKMFQFDYRNIKNNIGKKLIPIFESIDYYLSLLFKKYEVKDYNYFYKMHFYMTKKKICKKIKNLKFDESLLIQKDISYLIIPRLEFKKKLKQNYEIQNAICNGDFFIPRVVVITIKYKDEKFLESFIDEELNKSFLFNEFMKIIVGKTILNYSNLKRNKLISPFPQNYLYFLSYEKFSNLINVSDNKKYSNNFINLGKYSNWPDMPYFNDFLSDKKSFLESSFTEIFLNILEQYNYDVSKCDLLYYHIYNSKKKCVRVDQKCIDDCDFEKMFMEYYIDDKNKKIICNLNDRKYLLNKQCSPLYGNVFFNEYFEPKKMKEFLNSRKSQNLLMLKPSAKCKNNLRTIFFEYSDFYKDDPYYYIKNNINVEYTELNDSNYFVIAKLDKNKNYLTKFKNLIFNNIFVKNFEKGNYNLYWDYPYPNMQNIDNKYQLIGKFHDEGINRYNINLQYNKLKEQFPKDFNYIPETYFIPEQIDLVNKKFNKYKFNLNDVWIINQIHEENNEINDNKDNKSNNMKKKYPKIINSFEKEIKKEKLKENFVISKYISNPLLINNKKFTMRAYVLVTGFSPLKIYFYRDGNLIFSQNEYSLNNTNWNETCIHISSEKNELNCMKKNKKRKDNPPPYEKSLYEENCTIWNFLNFERYCKKNEINYEHIINQTKDIILKTFISLNDDIINKYKSESLNDRNMFQLFTFDFIIDNNYQLFLLDLDKNPYLNSKHLVPIYIYDHIFSDILNIVGIVPYNHENINKTYDNIDYNNLYKNEKEENVEEAICEFGRPRGMFELAFPVKNKINTYKKYFGNKISDENKILWENIEKNNDYI